MITLAKENLFAWMRTQLDAPLPPQIEDSKKVEKKENQILIETQGDLDDTNGENDVKNDEEEAYIQLEDVKTERGEPDDNHNHYDDLFSRQIDPDAEDEEEDTEADEANEKHERKRSHTSEESGKPSHKRKHQDEEDQTTIAPSEVESEETFRGNSGHNAAAVMRWDVAFARVFQKTLRCLSDIQDRTQRATETEDHQE